MLVRGLFAERGLESTFCDCSDFLGDPVGRGSQTFGRKALVGSCLHDVVRELFRGIQALRGGVGRATAQSFAGVAENAAFDPSRRKRGRDERPNHEPNASDQQRILVIGGIQGLFGLACQRGDFLARSI